MFKQEKEQEYFELSKNKKVESEQKNFEINEVKVKNNELKEVQSSPLITNLESEINQKINSEKPEFLFANKVKEILLNGNLLSFVKENLKNKFLKDLDHFIIRNFYFSHKDKELNQVALTELLLKFYKSYIDGVNEYYLRQEIFNDINLLLEFFKKENI